MKLYRHFITPILLLFFLTPGLGQEAFESLNKGIVGHWQTDLTTIKSWMEQGQRMAYDTLPTQAKEEIDRAMASREFIFHKDGVFVARWEIGGNANSVQGNWEVIGNKNLTIKVHGAKTDYMVFTNGTQGMVLVPQRERRGMLHELYFTKMQEE